MSVLKLIDANRIISGVMEKGRSLSAPPLTVVVLDTGGHTIALERADGCTFLRLPIAIGKAWGTLGLGAPSRQLEKFAMERPLVFQAISEMSEGRVVPAAGGVPVRTTQGELIGAVGVSGATSDIDELCAISGIEAAGFAADGAAG